ncbi:MAG: hypothetical protein GYA24_05075 [Candidatus Lokiarchaeota archaeon]|nr:hypothetical protein [Candidatus Lokiarchaeota archaeon]
MGKKTFFIADDEINSAVNDIVASAQEQIVLVSPWFELNTHLMDKILDALQAKIKVVVLTRPETENPKHKAALAELRKRGATINIDPVLHAKLVLTDESEMLMFSSNLIQTSLGRNHECGIYTEDKDLIEPATDYVTQIMERHGTNEDGGHCVCCNAPMTIDKKGRKVRCLDCYKKDVVNARFCHGCGGAKGVTIEKPLCKDCWTRLNKP